MNKLFAFLLSLMLIALIVSCKKETDSVNPTPDPTPGIPTTTPSAGVVTPAGTPEGVIITATIGPAGGIIESADKRVQVQIPAGALTGNQPISVQPLTNNYCPAGTGQAFRLMPHGLIFTKPATITFQYTDQDVNGSAPEALRVAYQNEQGSWQSPATKSVDTTTRTVSVQTMHFSDWGLFQTMYIDPNQAFLNPDGHVSLVLRQTLDEPAPGQSDDDIFIPLPSSFIDARYVERWAFIGEGRLIHKQTTGDYYAPDHIPADNPEVVTVFLNKTVTIGGQVFKDIRLVANLFVAPEGLSVQIDGGDWKTYAGGATINGQSNVILGRNGTETASLLWAGKPTGVYRWTKGVEVAFNLNKGTLIYQHLYGKAPSVSGGSLRVNNEDKDWVVGTFTVQPAGWVNTATPTNPLGTANIKGVFRVKRVPQ